MTIITRGAPPSGGEVDLERDSALVLRAQSGDHGAFDELYLRYYTRIVRFCQRRLYDAYEAEDVAQETFARAWRALPGFAGERRFYPWLSVIAANLCVDALRRRERTTPLEEEHQKRLVSTERTGEEAVLAAADRAAVRSAFLRLPERHQRVLNLEGAGMSYKAIAEHEGVGVSAVESLLWRARRSLRRDTVAEGRGRRAV